MAECFRHALPFGAEQAPDGGLRFRIWAPDTRELRLDGAGGVDLPMRRGDEGWFELKTDRLKPGDAYAYRLPDGRTVPDPAARAQAGDVHGESLIVDPESYRWRNADWTGAPWESAVISEVHVGTATPEGTFEGLRQRLGHFAETGITAIELMPVAQFSGRRGWGYDGVLLFAPHNAYGTPDELKRLIDEAHGLGLMVLLDVVYNHFGPDGNYLPSYAARFFDETRHTPWGAAIDFGRPEVRAFFVHNALYWLEEYRFDGLRFDAVDQIADSSKTHILSEIAERARGHFPGRQVHLVLENDRNEAHRLARDEAGRPQLYTAQWNDDFHHAAHVALTGENDGYYADYADATAALSRALAEGFVYQGETSAYRGGKTRGEPSAGLPPTAFVCFIQNHDQIGNRAMGERLTALSGEAAVKAALAMTLLGPWVPLMFQGDEWGETRPFQFFCDFSDELAEAVRKGRRGEFAKFARFSTPKARETIPDPNDKATFAASIPDWSKLEAARHKAWLSMVRELLAVRSREISPRLAGIGGNTGAVDTAEDGLIGVQWRLADGASLRLLANLTDAERAYPLVPIGRVIWPRPAPDPNKPLPPWTAIVSLTDERDEAA